MFGNTPVEELKKQTTAELAETLITDIRKHTTTSDLGRRNIIKYLMYRAITDPTREYAEEVFAEKTKQVDKLTKDLTAEDIN